MTNPREQAAIYNDILATAGAVITRMRNDGHISERWEHQLKAQLNATLYTLSYALPAGVIQVQLEDTSEIRYAAQVEASKRKVKG